MCSGWCNNWVNRSVYFTLWRNIVLFVRSQKTIRRMRIAYVVWITKATSTHSEYILLFHWNNGCMHAPYCYVIHTLPVLVELAQALISLTNILIIRLMAVVWCWSQYWPKNILEFEHVTHDFYTGRATCAHQYLCMEKVRNKFNTVLPNPPASLPFSSVSLPYHFSSSSFICDAL